MADLNDQINVALAKELVLYGRKKKQIEQRALEAFNAKGEPNISDKEMVKLAVDMAVSVELFVEAGILFSEHLDELGLLAITKGRRHGGSSNV